MRVAAYLNKHYEYPQLVCYLNRTERNRLRRIGNRFRLETDDSGRSLVINPANDGTFVCPDHGSESRFRLVQSVGHSRIQRVHVPVFPSHTTKLIVEDDRAIAALPYERWSSAYEDNAKRSWIETLRAKREHANAAIATNEGSLPLQSDQNIRNEIFDENNLAQKLIMLDGMIKTLNNLKEKLPQLKLSVDEHGFISYTLSGGGRYKLIG